MRLIHFVINISQKRMSSADIWMCQDSVLGHEDRRAANLKNGYPAKPTVIETLLHEKMSGRTDWFQATTKIIQQAYLAILKAVATWNKPGMT